MLKASRCARGHPLTSTHATDLPRERPRSSTRSSWSRRSCPPVWWGRGGVGRCDREYEQPISKSALCSRPHAAHAATRSIPHTRHGPTSGAAAVVNAIEPVASDAPSCEMGEGRSREVRSDVMGSLTIGALNARGPHATHGGTRPCDRAGPVGHVLLCGGGGAG